MNAIHDSRGYPIHKGDLLRSPHFRGARRKQYWLYHVAVEQGGELWAVPAAELEPTHRDQGGRVLLRTDPKWVAQLTIIAGYGPPPFANFEDRPRKKVQKIGTSAHNGVASA